MIDANCEMLLASYHKEYKHLSENVELACLVVKDKKWQLPGNTKNLGII